MRKNFIRIISVILIVCFTSLISVSISSALEIENLVLDGNGTDIAEQAENDIEIDTNIYISSDGNYKYQMVYEDYYYDEYDELEGEEVEKKGKQFKGVSLIKYIGKNKLPGVYSVPERIDGYKVSNIYKNAFKGYNFTKLIINNEYIIIGDSAFYGCKKLKKVILDSPYTIGSNAFYGCKKLSTLKVKNKNCYTFVERYAFCNCPRLKSAYISYLTEAEPYSFGYFYDKASKSYKKISGFAFRIKEHNFGTGNINYAYENNIKCVCYLDSNTDNISAYAQTGEEYWFKINGKSCSGWKSSDPNIIKISNKGKATFLQSGEAAIKVKLKSGKTFKRRIYVNNLFNLPRFETKSISIKKRHTSKIYIIGKANSIDYVCVNKSKIAKIVSKKSSKWLKIKGLKKGTTTLKIKVNGVKTLKIKVKVI